MHQFFITKQKEQEVLYIQQPPTEFPNPPAQFLLINPQVWIDSDIPLEVPVMAFNFLPPFDLVDIDEWESFPEALLAGVGEALKGLGAQTHLLPENCDKP